MHGQKAYLAGYARVLGGVVAVKVDASHLLTLGAFGFLLSFGAWLFWLLMVVSGLLFLVLGYGLPGFMSGIFFQSGPYHLIFRSLLSVGLALQGCGCIALKLKYGSTRALICGVLYLAIAAVLTAGLALPLTGGPYFLVFLVYEPTLLVNVGLVVLGVTLLLLRRALPYPSTAYWVGLLFTIVGVVTLAMFSMVVLYWGSEFWLLLLGWLYAATSVGMARLLLRLRTA